MAWLDTVTAGLTLTRDATREKVTAVADTLTDEVARLQAELQAALLSLGLAEQRIAALESELAKRLPPAALPQ